MKALTTTLHRSHSFSFPFKSFSRTSTITGRSIPSMFRDNPPDSPFTYNYTPYSPFKTISQTASSPHRLFTNVSLKRTIFSSSRHWCWRSWHRPVLSGPPIVLPKQIKPAPSFYIWPLNVFFIESNKVLDTCTRGGGFRFEYHTTSDTSTSFFDLFILRLSIYIVVMLLPDGNNQQK